MRPFLNQYHLFINKVEDLAHTPHISDKLQEIVEGRKYKLCLLKLILTRMNLKYIAISDVKAKKMPRKFLAIQNKFM